VLPLQLVCKKSGCHYRDAPTGGLVNLIRDTGSETRGGHKDSTPRIKSSQVWLGPQKRNTRYSEFSQSQAVVFPCRQKAGAMSHFACDQWIDFFSEPQYRINVWSIVMLHVADEQEPLSFMELCRGGLGNQAVAQHQDIG